MIHESFCLQWDLICDREILRTTVQVALYIGKFVGAFVFGIIADKYTDTAPVKIFFFYFMKPIFNMNIPDMVERLV